MQFVLVVFCLLASVAWGRARKQVTVEILSPNPEGEPVIRKHRYISMVTLYIEHADKSTTPSGWSTREADGAAQDTPFHFQPGIDLIKGWTDGVLQMKEGERALLHVPYSLGYGEAPLGSPDGPFYIPKRSDLLFDIEILGRETPEVPQDL